MPLSIEAKETAKAYEVSFDADINRTYTVVPAGTTDVFFTARNFCGGPFQVNQSPSITSWGDYCIQSLIGSLPEPSKQFTIEYPKGSLYKRQGVYVILQSDEPFTLTYEPRDLKAWDGLIILLIIVVGAFLAFLVSYFLLE